MQNGNSKTNKKLHVLVIVMLVPSFTVYEIFTVQIYMSFTLTFGMNHVNTPFESKEAISYVFHF